jgi:methylmalonyl-CoA/ethylmalonyl-CoA epimerase
MAAPHPDDMISKGVTSVSSPRRTGNPLRRAAASLVSRTRDWLDRYGFLPEDPEAEHTSERPISINHVGLCVPNIEAFLKTNAVLYGGFQKTDPIDNRRQHVREVFLTDGSTVIELLEPKGEASPLAAFLKKNPAGGLVHVCIECDDIDAMLGRVRAAGGMLITGPVPDVAFDERPIAFCALADQVVEIVQRDQR